MSSQAEVEEVGSIRISKPRHDRSRDHATKESGGKSKPSKSNLAKKAIPFSPIDDKDETLNDDSDPCHICSSHIVLKAYYPCSHNLCYKCSMRRRALAKDQNCLFCRTECPEIVVSSDTSRKSFADFSGAELSAQDKLHGINFTNESDKDKTARLLKFVCRVRHCPDHLNEFTKWSDLKRHVREEHDKRYCDLCITHLQAFPFEQLIYTQKQLRIHEQDGDKARGFAGHPKCQFCGKRYYTNDELMAHCIRQHEKCFICERDNPTQAPKFFKDYEALEEHFNQEHYACQVKSCVDKKFIVFRHKEELQHHMLEEHKEIIGKSKSPLIIDADIGLKRGGKKYVSELSTIPNSTSGSNTTQYRGSSSSLLTNADAFPELGSSSRRQQQQQPVRQPANVTTFHSNLPTQDETINSISRRLDERVKILLQRKPEQRVTFDEVNDKYINSRSMSEDQLISQYRNIFSDCDDEQLEVLLHEFSRTLELRDRQKSSRLQAKVDELFNHMRVVANLNSAYISKPISGTNGTWKGNTSLKTNSLKSSDSSFPALPASSSSRTAKPLTKLSSLTASRPGNSAPKPDYSIDSAPKTTTGMKNALPSAPSSVTKKVDPASFPALPSAASKHRPVRNLLASQSSTPKESAWGPKKAETIPSAEELPEIGIANKGKGKKKVLYQFSAFS